jgi:flagellar biosynthesis/type III secretory pathway protein FliH
MKNKDQMDLYCFPEINKTPGTDHKGAGGHMENGEDALSQKIAAVEAQAFEDGHKQGCSQAIGVEKEKLSPLKEMLVSAVASIQERSATIRDNCEDDIVRIALSLAGQMIAHEIEHQPELTGIILEKAVDRKSTV